MLTECYDISAKRELLTAAGLEDENKKLTKKGRRNNREKQSLDQNFNFSFASVR